MQTSPPCGDRAVVAPQEWNHRVSIYPRAILVNRSTYLVLGYVSLEGQLVRIESADRAVVAPLSSPLSPRDHGGVRLPPWMRAWKAGQGFVIYVERAPSLMFPSVPVEQWRKHWLHNGARDWFLRAQRNPLCGHAPQSWVFDMDRNRCIPKPVFESRTLPKSLRPYALFMRNPSCVALLVSSVFPTDLRNATIPTVTVLGAWNDDLWFGSVWDPRVGGRKLRIPLDHLLRYGIPPECVHILETFDPNLTRPLLKRIGQLEDAEPGSVIYPRVKISFRDIVSRIAWMSEPESLPRIRAFQSAHPQPDDLLRSSPDVTSAASSITGVPPTIASASESDRFEAWRARREQVQNLTSTLATLLRLEAERQQQLDIQIQQISTDLRETRRREHQRFRLSAATSQQPPTSAFSTDNATGNDAIIDPPLARLQREQQSLDTLAEERQARRDKQWQLQWYLERLAEEEELLGQSLATRARTGGDSGGDRGGERATHFERQTINKKRGNERSRSDSARRGGMGRIRCSPVHTRPTLEACRSMYSACPFPWVVAWNGRIWGVVTWDRVTFRLERPMRLPSRGLPAASLLPVATSPSGAPPALGHWPVLRERDVFTEWRAKRRSSEASRREIRRQLRAGWRVLEAICVPYFCGTLSVFDTLRQECISTMMEPWPLLYPRWLDRQWLVTNQKSDVLRSKRWHLPYLVIARRDSSTGAQIPCWLTGLIPFDSQTMDDVLPFPADIPVPFEHDLQTERFLLPEVFWPRANDAVETVRQRGQLANHTTSLEESKAWYQVDPLVATQTGSAVRGWAQLGVLTRSEANRLLLSLQRSVSEPILFTPLILDEAYDANDGTFLETTAGMGFLDVRGRRASWRSIVAGQATHKTFTAVMVDRDLTTPHSVHILAGWTSQMYLVLPEMDQTRITFGNVASPTTPTPP